MKISLWQQLPLYLCAMGHDDAALAVDHLRKAIGMYDGSKSSARHCKFTIQYLGETSKIRPHIERFIESNGQDVSAVFRVHANRCKLVRTNEISVESLHSKRRCLPKRRIGMVLQPWVLICEGTRVFDISPCSSGQRASLPSGTPTIWVWRFS